MYRAEKSKKKNKEKDLLGRLDVHDLLAVVITAMGADVMRSDAFSAVGALRSVGCSQSLMSSADSLSGYSGSSCRYCHIQPPRVCKHTLIININSLFQKQQK